jgi:sphinganine-1-phosphate aldolase
MTDTMSLPDSGEDAASILANVRQMLASDYDRVSLRAGRMTYWSLSPSAIPEEPFLETARQAGAIFSHESQFYITSQPSIHRMTADVLAMVRPLVAGGVDSVVGAITMGGTESIFLAIKAARDLARSKRRVLGPTNIVVPRTAHPAFNKAASYLDMEVRRTPVTPDFVADVSAMYSAIDEHTVLIAGSAPSYTHGTIDPIAELGALAVSRSLWLHVDACIGGFIAPFIRAAGQAVPPFGFEIPGVTSISVDLHKHAFAPIGISTLFCRDAELQAHHFFVFDDWPAGTFRSPIFNSSRPAAPLAGAWATMKMLGSSGYQRLAHRIVHLQGKLLAGIHSVPLLQICGNPVLMSIAYTSRDLDIQSIADHLSQSGWYNFQIKDPPGLHIIVEPYTDDTVCDSYLRDLRLAVAAAPKSKRPPRDDAASYSQ